MSNVDHIVRAIVQEFKELEAARGPFPDTFINPFTKQQEDNGCTVRVKLLHELASALEQEQAQGSRWHQVLEFGVTSGT